MPEFIPGSTEFTVGGALQGYNEDGSIEFSVFFDPCTDGAPVCHPWRQGGKVYCLAVKDQPGYDPYADPPGRVKAELRLIELTIETSAWTSTLIEFSVPDDSLRSGGAAGIDGVVGTRSSVATSQDKPPGKDWCRFFELGPDNGDPTGGGGGGAMLRNVFVWQDLNIVIPVFHQANNLFAYDYVAKAILWEKKGWLTAPDLAALEEQVNDGTLVGPNLGVEWVYQHFTPVVGTGATGLVVNVAETSLFARCLSGPSTDAWQDPDYPGSGNHFWPANQASIVKGRRDPPDPSVDEAGWYAVDPAGQQAIWDKWFAQIGTAGFGTAANPVDPENLAGDLDYDADVPEGAAIHAYLFSTLAAAQANVARVDADFEYALGFYRWEGTATYQVTEKMQVLDVRTGAATGSSFDLATLGTLSVDRETVNGLAKVVYIETQDEYHNPIANNQGLGGSPIGDTLMPGPYSEDGYVPSSGGVAGDSGWNVYLAGTMKHPLFVEGAPPPSGRTYCWAPGDIKFAGAGAGLGVGGGDNPITVHQWYPLKPYAGARRYSTESVIWPGSRYTAASVGSKVLFFPRSPGYDETTGEQDNAYRRNKVLCFDLPSWTLLWEFDSAAFHGPVPNYQLGGGEDSGFLDLAYGGMQCNPVVTTDRVYLACSYKPGNASWVETLFELDLETGDVLTQRDFNDDVEMVESAGILSPKWTMFGAYLEAQEMQLVKDETGVGTLVWRGTYRETYPGPVSYVIRRLRLSA